MTSGGRCVCQIRFLNAHHVRYSGIFAAMRVFLRCDRAATHSADSLKARVASKVLVIVKEIAEKVAGHGFDRRFQPTLPVQRVGPEGPQSCSRNALEDLKSYHVVAQVSQAAAPPAIPTRALAAPSPLSEAQAP